MIEKLFSIADHYRMYYLDFTCLKDTFPNYVQCLALCWKQWLQKLWLDCRWADVQVFLDAPPSKPLLWSCLLAWALQRSLSNPPLICQSSHPTSHMQLQRHWPFKMHKIEIWQSFASHIFAIHPPCPQPFILFLLTPIRAPNPRFSTFSDIIMEAPCRCSSFHPHNTHFRR